MHVERASSFRFPAVSSPIGRPKRLAGVNLCFYTVLGSLRRKDPQPIRSQLITIARRIVRILLLASTAQRTTITRCTTVKWSIIRLAFKGSHLTMICSHDKIDKSKAGSTVLIQVLSRCALGSNSTKRRQDNGPTKVRKAATARR